MEARPLYIDKTGTDLKTGFGASRGPTQAKPGQDPQGPGTHQGATPAKNQQQRKEGGRGRTPEAQTDRQDKRQHDRQASRHHDRRTYRQTAEGRRRNKHTHPPGKHATTPPSHTRTSMHADPHTPTTGRPASGTHPRTHEADDARSEVPVRAGLPSPIPSKPAKPGGRLLCRHDATNDAARKGPTGKERASPRCFACTIPSKAAKPGVQLLCRPDLNPDDPTAPARGGHPRADSTDSAEDHLGIARLQRIAELLPGIPDYPRALGFVHTRGPGTNKGHRLVRRSPTGFED